MRTAATAFGVPELEPEDADVIVDALFGSGFHGRLEGAAEALVARVNELAAPIVALDVPSGVDGASGRVEGTAIQAALTLAFHGRTLGTAIEPGRGHAGEVIELPIGLPGALAGAPRALRMDPADLALVPSRSPTGSKYDSGGVLVVGGSPGMSGAPALAALAALRSGAGVVWVCVPESERGAVAAHGPELMVQGELEPEHVLELAARARAVVAGPGLGRAPGTSELVDALVRGVEVPLVLDADALFALAGRLQTLRERAGPTALTPHAGELGRLLGRDSDAIAGARLASVTEAAELSGAAVLLKGPDTLVADNGEPLRVVETPCPSSRRPVPATSSQAPSERCARAVCNPRRRLRWPRSHTAPQPAWRSRRPVGSSPPTCSCRWDACSREAFDARDRPRRRARERAAADPGRERQPPVGRGQGRRLRAWRRRGAGTALSAGAERICCATLEEARELREGLGGRAPIVVLSPLQPGEEVEAGGLEIVVSSLEAVRQAARRRRVVRRARQGRHRHGPLGHDACRRARRGTRARRREWPPEAGRGDVASRNRR